MFELLLVLAIYTVIILLFVPLEKIGKYQTLLKKQVQKIMSKMKD